MTALYQLTPTTNILRMMDNATIPADRSNYDYQVYLAWVSQGNTPDPIPQSHYLWSFISQIQGAINESDKTMLRVNEAISLGLNTITSEDVVAYVDYRRTLRSLLASQSVTNIPSKPPYPAGT